MKKIMLIAAAAAGLVAMADGVESGVVGYNTVTIQNKYNILGVNFAAPNGQALSIQDVIPYSATMTKGTGVNSADQIQVMAADGSSTTYFLCNGKSGRTNVDGGDGKWVQNGKAVVSDAALPPGTAFWYIPNTYTAPFQITVAGGVLSSANESKTISATYSHFANPYAADLPLNNCIPYVEGMTKGTGVNSADQIQIVDADLNYTVYFLCNGKSGRTNVEGGDGKWVQNGKAVVTDAAIPVGRGAWFVRKGETAFDLKIVKPYDL